MIKKDDLIKYLCDLRIDCEKVIENLTNTGCDEAWSIIKLKNMITDIDLAITPDCQSCEGSGVIIDTHDFEFKCGECEGIGKPIKK